MINGLSGERMLIGLAIGIIILVFLVLKTKIQAFLALIITTILVGVIGGMPLLNTTIEVDGVTKTFGIIKDSGLGSFMADGLAKTAIPIILLPLVISTAMRFIQGSGTVAMTTAASISAPILISAGVNPLLGAIACCVGSLFFGYFNDSYFWVVNRTLGVSEAKDQLTIWSITSTIAWAIGVVEVLVLSFFM